MSKEIGFEEIKDAKNIKETVMNCFPDYMKVDKVGKYEKFVTFPLKRGMYSFGSSSLECDELSNEAKYESLDNLVDCMKKHIDKLIEDDLRQQRNDLKDKYYKEFKLEKLIDAQTDFWVKNVTPETSEAY